jgi:hypothetical protein
VALAGFVLSLSVLLANGRAIGSGDTNAVERTATALAERGTVILPPDETADPFTRPADGGRISIYSPLAALLALPVFLGFNLFFDLTPSGIQIAGKLSAALLSSLAVALLAGSFRQRCPVGPALLAALLFGLGTSVFSTSQALWQHPAVVLFLVIAIEALSRMEAAITDAEKLRPGLVAALALSLAAAARPATIPMCAALFLFLLSRTRPHAPRLLAMAAGPALAIAAYNTLFFGAPWHFGPGLSGRFGAAFPESLAGLLVSPARGLFIFTPIALLALWGLVRESRRSALARALLAAASLHFIFMSLWNEWHGGESFGPRLLTDLLPALFFFLPQALVAAPKTGAMLGGLSIAIQLLGGWTYDYRWERLHQRGIEFDAALWSWRDSPIAFALREGVVVQGAPVAEGRRLRLALRRSTPFGASGSVIESTRHGLRISGAGLVRDIRLERGARLSSGWISLAHPGDAVAFRTGADGSRVLHLVGSLQGTLAVETRSGSISTPLGGDFDLEMPLVLESGEDVFVRAASGELRLARLSMR